MEMRLWTDQMFLRGILDFETDGSRYKWRERCPSQTDSNWGKHCYCCWFGQKWQSNRIKNDSRIFEPPQGSRSSDSVRGFGKEEVVCTFCSTLLDPWAKGRSSHILQRHYRDGRCRQNFLKKLITRDETWRFSYDGETQWHSSEWVGETSPRPKILKFQRSRIKTMFVNFFDSQGVVHKEFVPEEKK